ncbi:MAG: M67 family metallopeptidase [Candidatus Marinimicrobia bacterium]|jgi:proteasome lid subunit RPN8/RPN11|nr:M67 family metallopeptidase [Candidatus Neomarinimicrobiota bacterium]MDP6853302.1 M67 family metallopeptidase [Candidatus Neomarinimicrobiota bacterium]MDP6935896.1 M67 family metallopeptidase [Candidatus Neomarinimicrobiota bacterium]
MISVTDISAPDYGVNMGAIHLTQKIIDEFCSHAEQDYPHECCGFILGNFNGDESISQEYLPAANTKEENRERRFLIDPLAYQKAEDEADERELSVISVVHSHPDHPDKPSDFDRDHAWPGFSYIIISVQNGKAVSYRSWQLNEDRKYFIEENIKLKKEENENVE